MNKVDISRDKILRVSLSLLQESNIESLNMRTIAKNCGVSVGSIYNYFPTKAELEIALVEAMWEDIFNSHLFIPKPEDKFVKMIEDIYGCIHISQEKYGNFFVAHRTMIMKSGRRDGKGAMKQYFEHVKKNLLMGLDLDKQIKENIWTSSFTKSDLVDYVFGGMLNNREKEQIIVLKILEKLLYE